MRPLLMAGALLLSGCSILPSNARYDCPYPWSEVQKAEQHIELLLELPHEVMNPPVGSDATPPCGRVLIPGDSISGCLVAGNIIMLDESLLPLARIQTYRHEVCHLYEQRVLGVSAVDSAAHVGWNAR